MNFLSPAFLIGLPLVAVPLVIHLLSRRQQKRISWGAMRFLKEAATRKRRLWRLTDILLLLLRTMAFLFFIFALARPLLPATWLGESIPREIIVVLDQSMSMSRKVGESSLFDLQREKVQAFLKTLQNRDSVRVLLAADSPEWLTPEAIEVNSAVIRKLCAQIDGLKPTLGGADLMACLRESTDLEVPKDKSVRVIVVFSDRQKFGWRLEEQPLWTALRTRLTQAAIPSIVELQFVTEAEPETNNLCVNRIETPRAFAALDQPLNLTAHVQNHGNDPSSATLLTWRIDDQQLGVATISELAPGASTSVTISHQFSAARISDVACRLEIKDALTADNDAHRLVEVFERLPVLIIEEPVPGEPLDKDSSFVLAALGGGNAGGTRSGWRSVFEPTVIEPGALAAKDLSQYRSVVLADLRQLTPAAVEKLEAYVRAGGGLWITLGAQTDPTFFNEHLHRGGLGLAPLKLTDPVGDPNDREKFSALRASSETHPATTLLSDLQRLDLDRARVYRRHQFDPFSGRDVSVLLQVQHGDPVVVERKLERGRVLVQSIPLGVSWSTLPLCQVYVAMLHEWLWYLAEPALPKRNLRVGEAILESSAAANRAGEIILPDQRTIQLQPTISPGGAQFHYGATRLPGEYVLRVSAKENQASTTRFHVQRNPEESNLKSLSDEELQQLRSIPGFQLGRGFEQMSATGKVEVPKHPLAGWLLAALAAVLLGEVVLAGWTTHRRNLRLKPVSMTS